jgi:mRNA-degrading endonuclease YafQ of YafQ-DinJ toxin-antitoxin module
MGAALRRVRVYTVPGFRRRYQRFLPDAQVKGAMRTFNDAKRTIPPTDLPDLMRDHKLHGGLRGLSECHLAYDVLLIYTHANDVVTMIDCCTHEELASDAGIQIIRRAVRVAKKRATPRRPH